MTEALPEKKPEENKKKGLFGRKKKPPPEPFDPVKFEARITELKEEIKLNEDRNRVFLIRKFKED